MAIEFRATAFDTVITALTVESPSFTYRADAEAFVTISVANIKKIFKVQTFDSTGENVRFYVNKTEFNTYIDLSMAVMEPSSNSPFVTQDTALNGAASNQFAHDFIRYISFKVFGNSNGVGLFTNNNTVISKITTDFTAHYYNILNALDMTENTTGSKTNGGLTVSVEKAGDYYYVDSSESNQNALNVGWSMFQYLLLTSPSRATDFLASSTEEKQDFPFIAGDTISVYVTITANPEQKSIATLVRSAIDDRTYRIKIKVIA